MSKSPNIKRSITDATLPKTPIEIDGKTYQLCCDLGALSDAETRINQEMAKSGQAARVNLLFAMAEENLANTRVLFAAALGPYQPEISFDQACALVNAQSVFEILFALRVAWKAATPEAKVNPPAAQAEK